MILLRISLKISYHYRFFLLWRENFKSLYHLSMARNFLASKRVFVVHCLTRGWQFLSTWFFTLLRRVEKSWWEFGGQKGLLFTTLEQEGYFYFLLLIALPYSREAHVVLWLLLGYILYICGALFEAYIISPHLAKFIEHKGPPSFGSILGFHELEVFVANMSSVWFYLLGPRCLHVLLTHKS